MHKKRDSEGSKVAEDLKPVTKQSRELKDLCFALEQIVFMMDWVLTNYFTSQFVVPRAPLDMCDDFQIQVRKIRKGTSVGVL